ncbi:alpha/beta-hydrolase [Aulographum hederae CBS 113979]|uniref:Alpha/beta-hydrolase n=1 Tax=Aulographum hederae CBS 113979 TaxID=1176131 RepID=A0A6G1H3G2_9PEZI|nr:alpha/beta-hydrolase [Aulographum hederae CBS 113979]
MSNPYATLPSTTKINPTPFKTSIPEQQLQEFKQLLKLSRLGPRTFENSDKEGMYGVTHEWMSKAKKEWEEEFDWRASETKINSFPQYTVTIKSGQDELTIHFTALFSLNPSATPILFLHGWPGSFLEFHPIMEILQNSYTPETLPYHVIVPSLPGYAFSSGPPLDRDFDLKGVAEVVDQLMVGVLGFERYVAQGGDIGSRIARVLGVEFEGCKAIHLNFCQMIKEPEGVDQESITTEERAGLERADQFVRKGSAYSFEHATRPSTISFALSASPLALLAWIGEKFLAWSDPATAPSLSTILESTTLYYLTDSFPRAIYPYRSDYHPETVGGHDKPRWNVPEDKSMGYSWFPMELAPMPVAWVQKSKVGGKLWWKRHGRGGHFAALECPDVLLGDVGEFVGEVWKR